MTTLIEAPPPLFALGPRSQAMARNEMTTLNSSTGITRRTDPSFCRYDFVTPCTEAVRLFLRELGGRGGLGGPFEAPHIINVAGSPPGSARPPARPCIRSRPPSPPDGT